MHEIKVPTTGLRNKDAEALELFENQGKVRDIKQIGLRPWQFEFKKYLDDPT